LDNPNLDSPQELEACNDFKKFIDSNGNIIREMSEDGLYYAIYGENKNDNNTKIIKIESEHFWNMNHKLVNVIEFINPIHAGDGIWDEEYGKYIENQDEEEAIEDIEDIEDEENNYDDEYDESDLNINKLC
jgi:hypothetical protein